jgi:hypothetical protein
VNSLLIDGLCQPSQKASSEEWRAIPGYEGIYEASSIGRIRTAAGKTTTSTRHGVRVWQQRILHQKWARRRTSGKMDARITLYKDKRAKTWLVSRLICAAFHGGHYDLTVDHLDNNSMNNRADNLEWVTRAENIKRGFASGCYDSIKQPRRSAS